ncbi:hypothetical protein SKAU_G00394530 [Synaphobranchus kaupii]|uniref:Uncharacterized protein n=1 Tax=Synaphobranchus kaupii TaxID=118154 RepID=A0A9Q1EC98_SYNKA|nr:hypothetical protein SKAU_G00394530 [Synaphobranchus kaupii]
MGQNCIDWYHRTRTARTAISESAPGPEEAPNHRHIHCAQRTNPIGRQPVNALAGDNEGRGVRRDPETARAFQTSGFLSYRREHSETCIRFGGPTHAPGGLRNLCG